MIGILLILILSYVVGSIPTSILVARVVGKIDIREHGSGNAGMTNVFRILGWKPAAVVGIFDVLKGWFATSCIPLLPIGKVLITDVSLIQIMAGCAAMLGHTYTIFASFRGGKGVATMMGMLIALYPGVIPFCLITFVIVLMTWGYVSVASISLAIVLPITIFLLPRLGFQTPEPSLKLFSLILPLFILFTHRSNIKRLKEGTENRFERVLVFRRFKKNN